MMMASGNSSLTACSPTAYHEGTLLHIHKDQIHLYMLTFTGLNVYNRNIDRCEVCGVLAVLYLVPQVFGRTAYVGVEVRHVDELCDAGLSGCLGDLLRDGHEEILKAIVPLQKNRRRNVNASEQPYLQASVKVFLKRTYYAF